MFFRFSKMDGCSMTRRVLFDSHITQAGDALSRAGFPAGIRAISCIFASLAHDAIHLIILLVGLLVLPLVAAG